MKSLRSLQHSLLVLVLGSTLLTLGKVVFFPATADDVATAFSFPEQVPLAEWQPVSHQTLVSFNIGESRSISGRQYQYIKNEMPLEIEMNYFVHTDGEVETFLKEDSTIRLQNKQQKQTDRGYYLLFVNQERAYLTACINPHGGSTVNSRQFKQNQNTADLPSRLLPWLFGQIQLKDERCLWANLSIPLNESSPEIAYQTLEAVWASWQPWWKQQFPQP